MPCRHFDVEKFRSGKFEMDFKILEKLEYLDDSADTALLEIRVWRATMFAITEAQRVYSEQMLDAVKIMDSYLEEEGQSESTKGSTVAVMNQLLDIVTAVASVHTQVWSEFCDIQGPYNSLMELEDPRYEQLKEKSALYWNTHQDLVDTTMAEKKTYLTSLERWTEAKERLSAMMSKKELVRDSRFSALTGRVDVALTKYQAHFRKEAKHRVKLAEQTEAIKQMFIQQEKEKLDCLLITIEDLLQRMKKILPKATEDADKLNFSLGNLSTEKMAEQSLLLHLKSFTFQKYEGPSDTDPTGPPQPILKEEDYKKKKPCPVSVFSVVARDNYIPQKKSESKLNAKRRSKKLQRKSSTSPDSNGQEDNSSEVAEAEGPNLGPLDIDDDLSLDDGLMFEKEKAKKKILSPTPPMNSFHAIESSNSLSEDTPGAYCTNDAIEKYLDNETEVKTQPPRDDRHGILKSQNTPKNSRILKHFEKLSVNKARLPLDVSNRISPSVKRKLSTSFNYECCKPNDIQRERKVGVQMENSTSEDSSSLLPDPVAARKPQKQQKQIMDKYLSKGSDEEKTNVTVGYRLAKRKKSKESFKDDKTTMDTANELLSGPVTENGKEVSVLVMKDRNKVEADEISLRAGMKIKQIRPANENGLAYGYKKNKFGIKKYGYYPANLVTLYNTRVRSADNLN